MANTLTTAAQNASATSTAPSSGCQFCGKQGLLILPLLCAVTPKSAGAPALPGHIGGHAKDIAIGESTYLLRTTRSGYWYLLVNRKGSLAWQCYASSAEGYLAQFAADTPPLEPPEFTCQPNTCGLNASMMAIERADQVDAAYLLFTPDPLTTTKLGEIKGMAESLCAKGQMVKLQPKAWQDGNHSQPNCLDAAGTASSVAEFTLAKKTHDIFNNPLAKALANSCHPLMSDGYGDDKPFAVAALQLSRLDSLLRYMALNKAVSVAAYDHIGITQALNDHRNDALNKVNDFLNTPDKEGQTNRWKFDALQAINEVKAGFEKGLVSDAMHSAQWAEDNLRAHHEPIFPDDTPEMRKLKLSWNNATKDYDRKTWPQRNPHKSAELEAALAQARADHPKELTRAKEEALQRWNKKYAPLLDAKAMTAFDANFDGAGKAAMAEAEKRVDDHLAWVIHDRYVDAFDIYDRKNMVSGLRFERQAALCTLGMTGIEKCAKQVDTWLTLPVTERKNIYMRGLLLNQADIEKEAAKALADAETIAAAAPTVAAISGDKMYKALKGLIGFFKSADAAFDEFLRDKDGQTRANFNASYEAGKLYKFAEINRSIFRAGITTLEMNHVGRVVGLALARLGGVTEHVVVDELLKGIDPQSPHPDTPLHPTKPAFNPNNKPTTTVDVPVRANVSPAHAARTGKQVAQQIEPELRALMTDAQAQHQARVQGVTYDIDEYLKNNRTNNYHQARIGMLLSVLETIALGSKVWGMRDGKVNRLQVIEASANIMSIVSIGYDIAYATTKSVREQTKDTTIKGAGDVVRGGYKMWAGAFGAVAGGLGIWADNIKLEEETAGANRTGQKTILRMKILLGYANTGLGASAAFSYSGPMLRRVEINLATSALKKRAAIGTAARAAEWLAKRVLLLRLVAWGSGAGWALTAGELLYYGYLYLQPSELEVWCKRCAFRNASLGSQPYLSAEQELEELAKARKLAKV